MGPEPGHRLPLCPVSLAFSHVTVSLHNIVSDCVLVLQIDLFLSTPVPLPPTSWKTISLCPKPDFSFPAPPDVLKTGVPAGAPHSRPEHARLGPSSFLVTFQVRKLDVPLMLMEPALALTPFPCVYSISCPEFLSLERPEPEESAIGFLRTPLPPNSVLGGQ